MTPEEMKLIESRLSESRNVDNAMRVLQDALANLEDLPSEFEVVIRFDGRGPVIATQNVGKAGVTKILSSGNTLDLAKGLKEAICGAIQVRIEQLAERFKNI